ncbi:MAG: hypothetical protein Q4G05_01620 [Clostridia bacterium]|nr:hypothetical protein [Clostridia bacterium]
MKMTLNKLIANDIINYGMSQTSGFSYLVFLDSYLDDFDIDSKNYILNNLDAICEDIASNENIAYFEFDKESKEFDMVFYWGNLMNETERYVYDIAKDKKLEDYFDLEGVKKIAGEILDDDQTKNLVIEKINNSRILERDL